MLNYKVFETNAYNDSATTLVQSARMVAQTFTPGISHTLTAVSLKLVDVSGDYADATVAIYATDSDGAPTGSALISALIDADDITESESPHWVDVVFSSNIYVSSASKYAIVISYSGGDLGWRYNERGTYEVGTPWTSTDGGTTWAEYTDGDLIFKEWGVPVQINNAAKVQLYPAGIGTYDQLQPRSRKTTSDKPNWMCVNSPADAPNEEEAYVAYNIFDNDGFMTGEDEGVAGRLSGTTATWKTGPQMNGLWVDGGNLEDEVDIEYLLKSPNDNKWYQYNWKRIAEVKSIQGDEALTFQFMKSGSLGSPCTDVWFYTPQKEDAVNLRYINPSSAHYPNSTPMQPLTGTWHFTSGSEDAYADGDGNAVEELISPCCVAAGPTYTKMWGVEYVVDDNHIHLTNSPTYDADGNTFCYCTFSQADDLTSEETATMWTLKTKKDSYLLKTTQMKGEILQVDIVFRCALTDTERITQAMIATYDSSDDDKFNSVAHVESTYERADPENHLCGTLTDGTGECDGSPVSLSWVAATGFPYYNTYNVNVTTAGTFTLEVEDGRRVIVAKHPTGPTISGGGLIIGPTTATIAVHDTGTVCFYAMAYDEVEYTDAEIAIATNAMIESAMRSYSRVVFAPGTWKQYRADLCASDYIHIGTNSSETGQGYIDAEDCDGSNDEVQWNAVLDSYRYAMLGNNATPGYYLEDYVITGRNMGTLSDSTATAQPFVRLNGVEVYGDEETLNPPRPTGISFLDYPDFQFVTFRQTLSRPGGGAWSLDDINSLEAGIVLGNVTNPNSADSTVYGYESINLPCCTQVYAEVFFAPSNLVLETTGFTQFGIKVFDNGMDEWCLKVYENGMNMYVHKVFSNTVATYFARGKELIRGITKRVLGRRRTKSSILRGRSSSGAAE